MKLDDAIQGLKEQLEYFDEEVTYQASIEGEAAEFWDELEVSADAVRVVLKALSKFTDEGMDSDALNSAVDVMRQKQTDPRASLQKVLWESIKDYAERAK